MAAKSSIGAIFKKDEPASAPALLPPSENLAVAPQHKVSKTRKDKHGVAAYLSKEAHKQLKQIALDEDAEVQELIIEGINRVFEARGKHRIA
jgi:ribosomal protein L32